LIEYHPEKTDYYDFAKALAGELTKPFSSCNVRVVVAERTV
jgi:hypothetical protein